MGGMFTTNRLPAIPRRVGSELLAWLGICVIVVMYTALAPREAAAQGLCHCCGRPSCTCHPGPCPTDPCEKQDFLWNKSVHEQAQGLDLMGPQFDKDSQKAQAAWDKWVHEEFYWQAEVAGLKDGLASLIVDWAVESNPLGLLAKAAGEAIGLAKFAMDDVAPAVQDYRITMNGAHQDYNAGGRLLHESYDDFAAAAAQGKPCDEQVKQEEAYLNGFLRADSIREREQAIAAKWDLDGRGMWFKEHPSDPYPMDEAAALERAGEILAHGGHEDSSEAGPGPHGPYRDVSPDSTVTLADVRAALALVETALNAMDADRDRVHRAKAFADSWAAEVGGFVLFLSGHMAVPIGRR